MGNMAQAGEFLQFASLAEAAEGRVCGMFANFRNNYVMKNGRGGEDAKKLIEV